MEISTSLACKLGSIAVHVEEALSEDGHPFDIETLKALLTDNEISEWLKQMGDAALLPQKRKRVPHD